MNVRKASAQQADADYVQTTTKTLKPLFDGVRSMLAEQQAVLGKSGTTVDESSMSQLVTILRKLNEKAKPLNNGKDVIIIPKSGVTITDKNLVALQAQAESALDMVSSASAQKALTAAVPAVAPPVEAPAAAPVAATAPAVAAIVPSPIKTSLTQDERTGYRLLAGKLSTIARAQVQTNAMPGPTRSEKSRAASLRDKINSELRALDKPLKPAQATMRIQRLEGAPAQGRKRAVLGYVTQSKDLVEQVMPKVEAGRIARAAARARVPAAQTDADMQQYTELASKFRTIKDDASKSKEVRDQADVFYRLLNVQPYEGTTTINLWNASELRRKAIFSELQSAITSLSNGDAPAAKEHQAEAVAIFKAEQALLLLWARIASDASRNIVSASAVLPDKSVAQLSSKRREVLAEYAKKNEGSLSAAYVTTLTQTISISASPTAMLAYLWKFAQQYKAVLDKDPAQREAFTEGYSVATHTFLNPNHNPYREYSREVRTALLAPYKLTNPTMSEAEIEKMLMNSQDHKYDDVLYHLFSGVVRLAPEPKKKEVSEAIGRIAKVTVNRSIRELEEVPYIIQSDIKGAPVKPEDPKRFLLAKTKVENAITESGMKDTDERVKQTRAMVAYLDKQVQAGTLKVSEASMRLYYLTLNFDAMRQYELWRATPDLISADASVLKTADARYEHAKWLYTAAYAVPETSDVYYPTLLLRVIDNATNSIVPKALLSTAGAANYDVLEAYLNPVSPPAYGTPQDVCVAHLRFAYALKDSPDFNSRTVVDAALGPLADMYNLMHPLYSHESIRDYARYGLTQRWIDTNKTPSDFALHEEPPFSINGHVPVETSRQKVLFSDSDAPQILRSYRIADASAIPKDLCQRLGVTATSGPVEIPADVFIKRREALARKYGQADGAALAREANQLLLDILDVRILQLSQRLETKVEVTIGGKTTTLKVREFANSDDPRRAAFSSAVEGQEKLRQVRKELAADPGRNLFGPATSMNPREAIAFAELLSARIEELPSPPAPTTKLELFPKVIIDTAWMSGRLWATATTQIFTRTPQGDIPLAQFEAEKRKADQAYQGENVTKRYLFVVDVTGHGDWHLQNPAEISKADPSQCDESAPLFLGKVVDGVKLPDGTIGKAMVVVKQPSTSPTLNSIWETVKEGGQPKVLYYVKPGTEFDPIEDATLTGNMPTVSTASATVHAHGDMNASVVLEHHGERRK